MAGGLYGSARTTPRVRAEFQASQETSGSLAKRYGLSRAQGHSVLITGFREQVADRS